MNEPCEECTCCRLLNQQLKLERREAERQSWEIAKLLQTVERLAEESRRLRDEKIIFIEERKVGDFFRGPNA